MSPFWSGAAGGLWIGLVFIVLSGRTRSLVAIGRLAVDGNPHARKLAATFLALVIVCAASFGALLSLPHLLK
ncbi:hypothetical protein ACC848_40045, partial [Rhizobium johnstonii]|jgi:hypothetical protein